MNTCELKEVAPGYYVNREGRIFSDRIGGGNHGGSRGEMHELHPTPNPISRYLSIQFWVDGVPLRRRYLHDIVCRAFHGEPQRGQEVCHKNGIRSDCRADNLKWGTRKENHSDKKLHGTQIRGEQVKGSKLTEQQVREIKRRRAWGRSLNELADEYGVSFQTISEIARGKTWKHVEV